MKFLVIDANDYESCGPLSDSSGPSGRVIHIEEEGDDGRLEAIKQSSMIINPKEEEAWEGFWEDMCEGDEIPATSIDKIKFIKDNFVNGDGGPMSFLFEMVEGDDNLKPILV